MVDGEIWSDLDGTTYGACRSGHNVKLDTTPPGAGLPATGAGPLPYIDRIAAASAWLQPAQGRGRYLGLSRGVLLGIGEGGAGRNLSWAALRFTAHRSTAAE